MFDLELEDHNRVIVSSLSQLKSIGAIAPSYKSPFNILIVWVPLVLFNFDLLYIINALSLEWNQKFSIMINPQCT